MPRLNGAMHDISRRSLNGSDMKSIAEWFWRLALLGALGWIGWELHRFHEDMLNPPADDQGTAAAAPDDVQTTLDDIRDDLAGLTQKVDAILVVMARSK
jgi:hypothetical protein